MYTADLTINGKAVSIHGDGATLTPASSGFALTEGVGSSVHLVGLSIVADSGQGIVCGPGDENATPIPSLVLDNVNIDSTGLVLEAYPCKVTARACHFNARIQNPALFIASPSTANVDRCIVEGRGIQALGGGAVVHVTNSLFVNQISNGEPSDPGPLIGTHFFNSTESGQAFASFCTFAETRLLLCGAGLPQCAGGTDPGACIDNSILTSPSGDAVTGTGCHVSYSIVMPQAATLNGTNNRVNVDPLFVGGGSYALKSSSPAVDTADPNAIDSIDLVGTPRPQGARNDIGAYEYKP